MPSSAALVALPIVLTPHPHVRVDRKVLSGSPHVTGSRVPVRRLYSFYKSGTSVEKILKRYPQLSAAKVFDALAFAMDNPEVIFADMKREADYIATRTERRPKRLPGIQQVQLPFMQGRPGPIDDDEA